MGHARSARVSAGNQHLGRTEPKVKIRDGSRTDEGTTSVNWNRRIATWPEGERALDLETRRT
jgi:hypothetical protein